MTTYSYNYDILCVVCNKPRYFGYTDLPDSKMCCCRGQDKIPSYDRRNGPSPLNKTNWQYKMLVILMGVLGNTYSVEFTGDKSFKVFNNQEYVLGRTTAYETANHWQTEVKDIIHIIIDQKITSQFQKLKGDDN